MSKAGDPTQMDTTFPKPGKVNPAYQGSQSSAPSKEADSEFSSSPWNKPFPEREDD